MEGKAPSSAVSQTSNKIKIVVHYTDGTSEVYSTSGSYSSISITGSPGYLTYIRHEADEMMEYYWYTYTEADVTTAEFAVYYVVAPGPPPVGPTP